MVQNHILRNTTGALPRSPARYLLVRHQPVNVAISMDTNGMRTPPVINSSHRNVVAPANRYSAQTLKENNDARPISHTAAPTRMTVQALGAPVHSRNQATTGSSNDIAVAQTMSSTARKTAAITI